VDVRQEHHRRRQGRRADRALMRVFVVPDSAPRAGNFV
jgi:hypothetical protein